MSDLVGVIVTLIALLTSPLWAPFIFGLMGALIVTFIIIHGIGALFSVGAYELKCFFYHMDGIEWFTFGCIAIIVVPFVAYIFYKMGVFDAISDILGG